MPRIRFHPLHLIAMLLLIVGIVHLVEHAIGVAIFVIALAAGFAIFAFGFWRPRRPR
jgi:Flp pilus assembly protein TadB